MKAEVDPSPEPHMPLLWVGLLTLLLLLVFLPALASAIQSETDYPEHINSALSLAVTGHFDRPRPQFLYHVLLILLSQVAPGESLLSRLNLSAVMLGIAYYLATGWMVFYWLAVEGREFIFRWKWQLLIFLTLTVMLVSAINLFTLAKHNLYLGYLTANTYHNPTILLSKPLSLLLFALGLSVFKDGKSSFKKLMLVVCLALLGTFAKPNYSMALLPALAFMAVWRVLKKKPFNWAVLGAITLPTMAALAWQYTLYQPGQAGGFEIAPLKVMNFYSPDGLLLVKFVLSIVFPATVYLLYYPLARTRLDLNLAWLVFAVAAAYAYLFAESTLWKSGNFTWASQIALFILFAISIRFLLVLHLAPSSNPQYWKLMICIVLLELHLLGGLVFYLTQLTPDWVKWW